MLQRQDLNPALANGWAAIDYFRTQRAIRAEALARDAEQFSDWPADEREPEPNPETLQTLVYELMQALGYDRDWLKRLISSFYSHQPETREDYLDAVLPPPYAEGMSPEERANVG